MGLHYYWITFIISLSFFKLVLYVEILEILWNLCCLLCFMEFAYDWFDILGEYYEEWSVDKWWCFGRSRRFTPAAWNARTLLSTAQVGPRGRFLNWFSLLNSVYLSWVWLELGIFWIDKYGMKRCCHIIGVTEPSSYFFLHMTQILSHVAFIYPYFPLSSLNNCFVIFGPKLIVYIFNLWIPFFSLLII